jgi:serine/threonine protein kinase
MGTPFYMAPEAVQGAEMTPLSDQYALGVVLRECATGKNPFEGNNFAEVVGLITSAKYTSLGEMNPRLSKRFVAIIERSMNVDPNNRFDDMRAMGRQLLLLAGQRTRITWGLTFGQEGRGPLALATLERKGAETPPQRVSPKKKRATAMLLGGVAVLSASLTSVFLTTDRDDGRSDAQARGNGEATPHSEVAAVMPNTPADDRARPSASNSVNAGASVTAAAERAADEEAVNREGSSGEADVQAEPTANKSRNSDDDSAESSRKPRRTVVRSNDRSAERRPRPAPPRRRPAPVVEEPEAEWLESLSKVPARVAKEFEVGSNNAPILD